MEKYKIFVGIDISNGWIDVAVVNDQISVHRKFDNNRKAFKQMVSWLKTFANVDQVLVCMEHTGIYGLPLWEYLGAQKIPFVVESGLQIKHSMGVRRSKTDKADAEVIARYIQTHHRKARLFEVPAKVITRLKVIFGYRERLVKVKKQLAVADKEISSFLSSELCKEVHQDTRGLIKTIDDRISKAEKIILSIIMSDPEVKRIYELINSVPGIGLITATYIIIVTRNFTRINSSRQLSRYGGMSPEKNDSGTIKRKAKVSRIGNKKLKALLSNCVSTNLRYDVETKEYFQRKLIQGKQEGVIINNLKNKILHRVYAVVNRGTNYVNIKKYAQAGKVA